MLGILHARSLERLRRHLAAIRIETAHVAFAAIGAFRHGLFTKRDLHDAMEVSSDLERSHSLLAFGTRLRRRVGDRS